MKCNNTESPYSGRTKWGDPWEAPNIQGSARTAATAVSIVTSPAAASCISLYPPARAHCYFGRASLKHYAASDPGTHSSHRWGYSSYQLESQQE